MDMFNGFIDDTALMEIRGWGVILHGLRNKEIML
jgi:hypothetical protein